MTSRSPLYQQCSCSWSPLLGEKTDIPYCPTAVSHQGCFTASNLYNWLGGPDGSVLACQIAIEVLMLLLYLYVRTLARKAFGAAPSYEARALFMFLLLSDGVHNIIQSRSILRYNHRAIDTPIDWYIDKTMHMCSSLRYCSLRTFVCTISVLIVSDLITRLQFSPSWPS